MEKLKPNIIRCMIATAFICLASLTHAQTYNADIASYLNKVEHPYSFLQRIDQLGVKMSGTAALDSTCNWLAKICKTEGYSVNIQKFLYGTDTLRNVEIVKKGSSDSCIIIGAHYDSWVGPGVNDNGSGDYAMYQIAKWIKPLQTKYTIRFIFFSGEEISYLGSKHYVQTLNKDSVKIKFMVNFDQLGGTAGESNMAVKCERDEKTLLRDKSSELASFLATCFSLYTNLTPVISPAYNSDYLSFRDSGYLITGVYQHSGFPYYHTSADVLSNMEFTSLHAIAKGAMASVLYWSEANVPVADLREPHIKRNISVYTTHGGLSVINAEDHICSIYNATGKLVLLTTLHSNSVEMDVSNLGAGIFFAYLSSGDQVIVKKFFNYP